MKKHDASSKEHFIEHSIADRHWVSRAHFAWSKPQWVAAQMPTFVSGVREMNSFIATCSSWTLLVYIKGCSWATHIVIEARSEVKTRCIEIRCLMRNFMHEGLDRPYQWKWKMEFLVVLLKIKLNHTGIHKQYLLHLLCLYLLLCLMWSERQYVDIIKISLTRHRKTVKATYITLCISFFPFSSMANKRLLYVGGLDETMTEATLHAAFIPFGEIKSCEVSCM